MLWGFPWGKPLQCTQQIIEVQGCMGPGWDGDGIMCASNVNITYSFILSKFLVLMVCLMTVLLMAL
jgi:hypothetical protein